jgi:hypothetical protein
MRQQNSDTLTYFRGFDDLSENEYLEALPKSLENKGLFGLSLAK